MKYDVGSRGSRLGQPSRMFGVEWLLSNVRLGTWVTVTPGSGVKGQGSGGDRGEERLSAQTQVAHSPTPWDGTTAQQNDTTPPHCMMGVTHNYPMTACISVCISTVGIITMVTVLPSPSLLSSPLPLPWLPFSTLSFRIDLYFFCCSKQYSYHRRKRWYFGEQ